MQNCTTTCRTDKLYWTVTCNSNYLKSNCFNTCLLRFICSKIRPWTNWDHGNAMWTHVLQIWPTCFSSLPILQNLTSFCLGLSNFYLKTTSWPTPVLKILYVSCIFAILDNTETLPRWCAPLLRNLNISSWGWSIDFLGGLHISTLIIMEVPLL